MKGEDGKPTISAKNQRSISLEQRNVSSESARKELGKARKVKPIKFDKKRPIDEIQKIDFIDTNTALLCVCPYFQLLCGLPVALPLMTPSVCPVKLGLCSIFPT